MQTDVGQIDQLVDGFIQKGELGLARNRVGRLYHPFVYRSLQMIQTAALALGAIGVVTVPPAGLALLGVAAALKPFIGIERDASNHLINLTVRNAQSFAHDMRQKGIDPALQKMALNRYISRQSPVTMKNKYTQRFPEAISKIASGKMAPLLMDSAFPIFETKLNNLLAANNLSRTTAGSFKNLLNPRYWQLNKQAKQAARVEYADYLKENPQPVGFWGRLTGKNKTPVENAQRAQPSSIRDLLRQHANKNVVVSPVVSQHSLTPDVRMDKAPVRQVERTQSNPVSAAVLKKMGKGY